jgi:hypothetical protein
VTTAHETATRIVSLAIADVNAQSTNGVTLKDDPGYHLLGDAGVIDSLGFAYFIVTIEQHALDELGKEIVLFDDEVMELDFDAVDNPFRTIGSLTEYVARKLT